MSGLVAFIRESNAIEGIHREPTLDEIEVSGWFMQLPEVSVVQLGRFQAVAAPGKPLREHAGLDVRVGRYIAPPGGPDILDCLQRIVIDANHGADPWDVHIRFEALHPYMDGNGRTGRILWAWQTYSRGADPFALSFLHRWYYETLSHVRHPRGRS